jgi:DNA repair exonuclease SbcCD ATPase subunit
VSPGGDFLPFVSNESEYMAKKRTASKETPATEVDPLLDPGAPEGNAELAQVTQAFSEKLNQAITLSGIDTTSTIGQMEVATVREVFGKHEAALSKLIPQCAAVKPGDVDTAKRLSLDVMRIRTAAEKNRLALNTESRSRIAVVDGANKALLHILNPIEAHVKKIVDDAAAEEERRLDALEHVRAEEIEVAGGSPYGYNLRGMDDAKFKELLNSMREEKVRKDKEKADTLERERKAREDAAEAKRQADAKAAEEKVRADKAEAEAKALRDQLAERQRKDDEAKQKQEEAAEAERKRQADEREKMRAESCRLTSLRQLADRKIDRDSLSYLEDVDRALTAAEARDWGVLDLEAEGALADLRNWLTVSKQLATKLANEHAKQEAAEAKKRADALAPDIQKLQKMHKDLSFVVGKQHAASASLSEVSSRMIAEGICDMMFSTLGELARAIATLK